MKTCLLLLIFSLSIIHQGQAQQNNRSEELTSIRVSPRDAMGGNVADFCDSVRYIPLETKKESIFGFISHLQVSDNYFVFFDYDTKAIYIFSKQGKYISKIRELPVDDWTADKYNVLSRFQLNKTNDEINVVYHNYRKNSHWLVVFAADGKVKKKQALPAFTTGLSDQFFAVSANTFLCSNNFFPESKLETHYKEPSYFYLLHNFDTITGGILPVDPDDRFLKRNAYRGFDYNASMATASSWSRYLDYTLRLIDDSLKVSSYQFIFPAAMVPEAQVFNNKKVFNDIDSTDYYLSGKRIITKVSCVGTYDSYLLLFLEYATNTVSLSNYYLYSLTSQTLYSFDAITPDKQSYFLPIANNGIGTINKGYVYNEVAAFQLFNAIKTDKQKLWKSDPALKTYLSSGNSKGNPVIIEMKLKNGL
ncbi:6-bladed beta-propeller [Chitinophaga pinensis]|uniref:6-bladed beta-propeller n=1 Tax=Chitinophaga pinensis (strain ATCC 43595 / DSM 2588 / LMG 13176 / NBRC 15968 / NCIMB 11800 / UQM 2034) TaxID=485918 RepID=A0A979GB91_CHIPD|nr:6-bladed beta-propeller [Chitinophaga pinensis]ACU64045.1 hypothetical protein Cpin_6641 [Chitinophaga pinensis DSM 2588]